MPNNSEIAEYNALRNEINEWNKVAISILQISIPVSLAVIGYLIQYDFTTPIPFLMPFFIILPSLFIVVHCFIAVMRISGYIRIYIEREGGLYYENRLLRVYSLIAKSKKDKELSLRSTIFWLYVGLGLLTWLVLFWKITFHCLVVWVSYGHNPSIDSLAIQVLIYLSPIPFYIYAYRLNKKNWRAIYDSYWQKVKVEEEGKKATSTSIKIDPKLWKEAEIEAIRRNMRVFELVELALKKELGLAKPNDQGDKNR
jgi:hypothetical protein